MGAVWRPIFLFFPKRILVKSFAYYFLVMFMKELKNYICWGAILVAFLGTIFHFVYKWLGENPIAGLFVPVNESTWEHMKLIFFPMLIFSAYSKKLSDIYPCLESASALGILVGTFLIPVLFYTYSGVLGFNIQAIDISIFYISTAIAFYMIYKSTASCSAEPYKRLLNFFVLIVFVAFIVFTIFPPDIAIFKSPI